MASNNEAALTAPQLNALFDILTHNETFHEIREMRYEANVARFGPPFTPPQQGPSPFPMLQLMASKFIGRSVFTEQGWADLLTMAQRLCTANLSDSYDKGTMGLRKQGAAGMSSGLESVARGVLAGAPRNPNVNFATLNTKQYDRKNAAHLEQAWEDAVQGMLYGDLLDRVFEAVQKSPDLDDVPPVARAALDYLMVSMATMLHYTYVLQPEGKQLLKMMDTMDTLMPYTIIKQTLRMGNTQTILNGMIKIALAKVGDKTLVQTMVSRTIKLDLSDLEKRADKIKKKSKDGKSAPKEALDAIDEYVGLPRSTQEDIRRKSQQEQKSIVAAILEQHNQPGAEGLSEEQHEVALEYLAIQLSIRDRREGVQASCKEKPDILSTIVKEQLGLLTPILKAATEGKLDLGQVITIQKAYIEDVLKTAKGRKDRAAGVDDFYAMLQRHVPGLWKFLSDGANRCPSLREAIYGWCRDSLHEFRSAETQKGELRTGAMTQPLSQLFQGLEEVKQQAVRSALDDHASFMLGMRMRSGDVLQDMLGGQSKPDQVGPSPVLPRLNALLDAQLLTPTSFRGPVRTGASVNKMAGQQSGTAAPDTSVVLEALGKPFRNYLRNGTSPDQMEDVKANLSRVSVSEPRDGFNIQKTGSVVPA